MAKFTVTLKDPDGPYEDISKAARDSLPDGLDDGEADDLTVSRADDLREFASRWLKYGEYVTIEFDTDAGTATVLEAK